MLYFIVDKSCSNGRTERYFLVWNLFLAWVPLFFALIARRMTTAGIFSRAEQMLIIISLGFWLLFFPNAPYLITDLMHLGEFQNHIKWFDSVGFFCAALAGLATGLYSLHVVHQVLNRLMSSILAWFSIAASTILSGFGLYLGRFIRFNSWDLFTKPFYLFRKSFHELQNPLAIQTTLVFTLVVMVLYVSMFILIPSRHANTENAA